MNRLKCIGLLAFGICTFAVAGGCGSTKPTGKDVSGATVKGRLLQNGKQMKLLKDETIHISFVQAGGGTDAVATPVEFNAEDCSFIVKGPSGRGIPPGKYKVSLSSDIYSGGDNRFADNFNTEVTPLVADVGPEEGQQFDVDIGTRRVTKKK